MKKKIVGIVVIIMLVTTFFSASAATNKSYKITENENLTEFMQPVTTMFHMERKPIIQPTIIQTPQSPRPSVIGTDAQVTTFDENDSHPNIAIDNNGNPLLVYDHETEGGYHEIYLQRSPDGGATWPEEQRYYLAGTAEMSAINPEIGISDDGVYAWVSFQVEQMDPHAYIVELLDIDDPSTWVLIANDLSNQSAWVGELSGDGYGAPPTLMWGLIADMKYGTYDVNETLHVYWRNKATGNISGLFWIIPEDTSFSHPTAAATGDYLYVAGQQNRPDRSRVLINFGPTDNPVYENWDWYWISSVGNLSNPRIAASEPYAYCVMQDDKDGSEDILCYTPATSFWTKHVIADSPDDEMYPSITAFGEIAICTFVKNGDLYMSKTEDSGETWSPPEQINDVSEKVVGDYRCADTEGPYMAWTDNRNDNKDIYCDVTDMPWIAIKDVSGGFGVSVEIANIGTADAKDVEWEIHVEGGILGLINKTVSNTIDIETGTSEIVKTGLLLGFGKIAIAVVSDGVALDNESGIQLIIFTIVQ